MDKVYHAFAYFVAMLLPLLLSAQCGAQATDEDAKAMVERSNQRCDDFYRYRRELEEIDRRREKDAGEIKKLRSEHDQAIELARQEYVKNRKKTIVDPRLEKEHDEQELAWREHIKIAEKRYAQQKASADAIARRGCRVPEMKEYDLED
jgi:cell division protein FtsB